MLVPKRLVTTLVLVSAGLAPSSLASSASATTTCAPQLAQVLGTAGQTTLYQYSGGPLMACGSFGKPLEIGIGSVSNFYDSNGGSQLIAFNEDCAVTNAWFSDRYGASDATAVVDLKRRSSVSLGEPAAPGDTILGPGCSVAFEHKGGEAPGVWRVDARGLAQAPAGTALADFARTLQGPVAGTTPLGATSQSRAKLATNSPVVLKRTGAAVTLRLRFNQTPQGLTVLVGGRPVAVAAALSTIQDAEAGIPTDRLTIQLPADLAARIKSGRRRAVEVVICSGGCVRQKRTVPIA